MIKESVALQKEFYKSKETLQYQYRLNALYSLREAVLSHENELYEALYKDLGKSKSESYMTEIGFVLKEVSFQIKHLKKNMKKKKVRTSITDFPARSFIQPSPYGGVLIISPWNYPVNLTLGPLAGAIAAGNTVIIKPSEYSVHTSAVLEKMISKTFKSEYIKVINGGIDTNQELLDQKFEYIFFTGSTNVGRIVMEKASKHLTPVSLELGGKSPTIVEKSANIEMAGKRIAFGKLLNSGQTCIAPDYVFVQEEVKDKFIESFTKHANKFYEEALSNEHFGSIISERHFNRLVSLYENEEILLGGESDSNTRKIKPTLIDVKDMNTAVMQEEIFGPILPLVTFSYIDEVIDYINDKPSPLALYLFTEDHRIEERVLHECQFGGGCVNDTIVHIASDALPFGGVGASGMGSYHGKSSFETFSHYKSILRKRTWFDLPVRYAPYTKEKDSIIKKFLK